MTGSSEQSLKRQLPPAPRKRVLIDASPVTGSVDGLSIYIVNLIKNLPASSLAEFEFTVLLNPGVDWPDLAAAMLANGISELRAPIAAIGPRRDWDMARFLRRHRGEFDLIHITSFNYPFALKGGVCTIHDVTFRRWLDRKRRIPGWVMAARWYLSRVIRNALRSADAIIAVSGSTRDELVREFALSPAQMAKVKVIHEGWEHIEQPEEEDHCEPFGFERGGYLFFLGSYRIHKNLTNLLEAFRLALDHIPEEKILVTSGSRAKLSPANRTAIAAINAKRERVVFTGYVSNACVRHLYRHADAFIMPSLAEGFGLPVLEAFHLGTPVLCSQTTSLPEVAGDAAAYFDPTRPADIARAVIEIYQQPALRTALIEAGKERLSHFSWKTSAAETVELYRECLDHRSKAVAGGH